MCVLIMDKQPLIRRGITDALSMNDTKEEIYEVDSIVEAKKVLKVKNFHLAIIGFGQDMQHAFDFINHIKSLDNHIKIIILTESNNLQEFLLAKDIGIEGYLLKNIGVEDLQYAIKVIQRGEHFFSNQLLEKALNQSIPNELKDLTAREREVFNEVCQGLPNIEIGKKLYITEATTKKHISNILAKLHLSNRVEVIFYANKVYENQFNSRGVVQ